MMFQLLVSFFLLSINKQSIESVHLSYNIVSTNRILHAEFKNLVSGHGLNRVVPNKNLIDILYSN